MVLERSEVGLVSCQLVTSLGGDWDQESYDSLTINTPGFRFSTFLTLLETKYLSDVEEPVLIETVTALASTFLCDVIKKVCLGEFNRYIILYHIKDFIHLN